MLVIPMRKLDAEEKEILDAFDSGKLKSVKNREKEPKRHKEIAAATFKKDSRINIRISSKDLRAFQKCALAEGVPYQTLIASVLHKFVDGHIVEPSAYQDS